MQRKTVVLTYALILLLPCVGIGFRFIKPVRSATTWTVDDDGPADFSTIWEALTAANSGDTLYVYNGTYEHFPVNKNVSLVGESRDSTIIDGAEIDVTIRGHVGFSISGFTIQNGGTGILLYETSGSNISDNMIINNEWYGIILNGSNNTIINGNVVANNTNAVGLWNSFENLLSGNTITNSIDTGMDIGGENNTLRNNNMTGNRFNLNVWSVYNDIDVSNTVNGKPVLYFVNQHDLVIDPTTFPDIGYLALINSTNVTIRDLTLTNNDYGVRLAYTTDCLVENVKASHNSIGIRILEGRNNTIIGNSLSNNSYGISLFRSIANQIAENVIENNDNGGIVCGADYINPGGNNHIRRNTITNNAYGIAFSSYCSNNTICHNNFINNHKQVEISGGSPDNVWDDGYPSGGNYWSDLNPPDADLDQIGDTPYVIDEDKLDQYPLIYPYGFVPSPDVNDDGRVNIKDLFLVARAFGTKPGESNWNPIADVEMDETIGIKDLYKVAKDYGKTV